MSFLKNLWKTVTDLLTSKKFLVTALTAASHAVIKDPTIRELVTGSGAAYVLGQGVADLGKYQARAKELASKVVDKVVESTK